MRFTIEKRHLTDTGGKPLNQQTDMVSYHQFEADSADEAVRLFIKRDDAELVGDILRFPGFHAVATARKTGSFYTLQVSPATQPGR